jgi:dTMP kinase
MSKVVAFEGIDGSGKTSYLQYVEKALVNKGKNIKNFSFPVYESFFGKEIGALLSGKNAVTALTVDPKSMSLWYALDRWNALKNVDFSAYDYIFFNRYTLSNAVYQSLRQESGAEALADWIFELEHDILSIPKPDLYLVFDIDADAAQLNVGKKGNRDYIGNESDVYERKKGYLNAARELYKMIETPGSRKKIISVIHDTALLSISVIGDIILEILERDGLLTA